MAKKSKNIKIRIHEAVFVTDKKHETHVFVNIANRSKFRQLTITHLYYEYPMPASIGEMKRTLDIIPSEQAREGLGSVCSFPITLQPSECIEIAISWLKLPNDLIGNHFTNFRVRTSDGKWYHSKKNHTLATGNVNLLRV
ncbi:MAG: hypothetical protein IMZ64_06595 [Bacteroidetes bacterium]|nr:hypothetical protein [Bacteroidota bacterium]